MMRYYYLLFFCCFVCTVDAQLTDTLQVDDLFQRILNEEAATDSLMQYAGLIKSASEKMNYKMGMGYAMRTKGLYHETRENYDSALHYYLLMEELGSTLNEPYIILGALNSQFQIHFIQKQYESAKTIALKAVAISSANNALKHLSAGYSNLGIICRREKKYDSAFYYYKQSLAIKEKMKDSAGIANTNINISGLMLYTKQYDKVIEYILPTIGYHKSRNRQNDLWYDYTNIGIAYGYKNNFSKGLSYLDSALAIAQRQQNKANEAETYKAFGEVHSLQGNWQKAYDMMVKANDMEGEVINEQAGEQLIELQQKYKTKEKEQQNKLLAAEIEQQKLKQRNTWIGFAAIALIAFISFVALQQNRKKKIQLEKQNKLINEQNKKLTELNDDKNQLISMVSHDLSQPLNNIRVWSEILAKQTGSEAVGHIQSSVQYGQQLIRNVLDVEKAGANAHSLHFQTTDIDVLLQDLINDFKQASQSKNMQLLFNPSNDKIFLTTDKQHLRQVLENLISNALKFSDAGKNILLAAKKSENHCIISVHDEGPGINETEVEKIFNKYSIASAKPTAGEASTGLGLNIVKRLMLELGGKIEVDSEAGKGTIFKLIFNAD